VAIIRDHSASDCYSHYQTKQKPTSTGQGICAEKAYASTFTINKLLRKRHFVQHEQL
jgi:hypothetical protein